jgi:hypothetical protein
MKKLLLVAMFLGLAACAPEGAEPGDPSSDESELDESGEELISKNFKSNAIVDDVDMVDWKALSADEIDDFLARPYPDLDNDASCLATYTSKGRTAGQVLAEKAKKYKVNPIFLLAHLQKESGLVSNNLKTCPASKLAKAFGCGCPDGGSCSAQQAGFEQQVECAAGLTRDYLDDLDDGKTTISGWRPGKAKTTLDGRGITPQNKATAVLYTYTPWVGDKNSKGNKAPFGNYLFWKVWVRYAKTLGYAGLTASPAKPACTSDAQCNGNKEATNKVCAASGSAKGMCVEGCHQDSDCPSSKFCSDADLDGEGVCVSP